LLFVHAGSKSKYLAWFSYNFSAPSKVVVDKTLPPHTPCDGLPFYDGGGGGAEGGGGKGCWGIGGFLLRTAIVAATMTIMMVMPAMM